MAQIFDREGVLGVYLPENINRAIPNNAATRVNQIFNNAISLYDWLLCAFEQTEVQTFLNGLVGADNGLTFNSTTNNVELGGTLIQATSIAGGGFGFDLSNVANLSFQSNANITTTAAAGHFITGLASGVYITSNNEVVLDGQTRINVRTPNVTATTATNGQVLTLIDQTTGESEWANAGAATISFDVTAQGEQTATGLELRVNDETDTSYTLEFGSGLSWLNANPATDIARSRMVALGGALRRDTQVYGTDILGGGTVYDFSFLALGDYIVNSDTVNQTTVADSIYSAGANQTLTGTDTVVRGNTSLQLETTLAGTMRVVTPAIQGATAVVGQALTLTNVDGTVEYQSVSATTIRGKIYFPGSSYTLPSGTTNWDTIPVALEHSTGITLGTNTFQVAETGSYQVTFQCNISNSGAGVESTYMGLFEDATDGRLVTTFRKAYLLAGEDLYQWNSTALVTLTAGVDYSWRTFSSTGTDLQFVTLPGAFVSDAEDRVAELFIVKV